MLGAALARSRCAIGLAVAALKNLMWCAPQEDVNLCVLWTSNSFYCQNE
jgi:hypothetical protein